MSFISRGSARFNWHSCTVASLKFPAMIVYDMVMNVLETKWFPQHNIAGLISGITLFCFSQEKPLRWKEINTHTQTHTHIHTHTHTLAAKNITGPKSFLLLWKFLNYLVCVLCFKSINKLHLPFRKRYAGRNFTPTLLPAITGSKYVGGNRVNWNYWAICYIELQNIIWHCILQTILHVFLFIFGTKLFVHKTAVFYICFIWFGVWFNATALKVLLFIV